MDKALSQPFRDHWYQSVDGLSLYARDYAGPPDSALLPVLCLHGLTRNSADFAYIANHLAGERRVISADQRGRGRSDYDQNADNYNPATYVADTFKLLDELQIKQVIVIGTSMGGLMAMIMANMQPQRFAGIVMNDVGPELDPKGLERIKGYVGKSQRIESWEDAIAQTRETNAIAFPDFREEDWLRFTRGLFHDVDGLPVIAHDLAIAKPIQASEENAVPPDLWPLFQNMAHIPMLLVRGALSDLLSLSCVEKMQALAPDMAVAQIPQRGHAPMLDEPDAVQAIDAFLAKVDAAED